LEGNGGGKSSRGKNVKSWVPSEKHVEGGGVSNAVKKKGVSEKKGGSNRMGGTQIMWKIIRSLALGEMGVGSEEMTVWRDAYAGAGVWFQKTKHEFSAELS